MSQHAFEVGFAFTVLVVGVAVLTWISLKDWRNRQ
jgi:hypothetical protein